MIHIRKFLMIAATAVSAVSAITGCVEKEVINIPDTYRRAYITTDIYPQNAGHYALTTTRRSDALNFGTNRLELVKGGETLTAEGIKSYKVYFRSNYAVNADLTGTLSVAENLLEEGRQLLPAEAYTLSATSTIKAGSKEGEPFVIEFKDGIESMELGTYVLPLVCTLAEGSDVELSSTQNSIVLTLENSFVDASGDPGEAIEGRNERILHIDTDFTYAEAGGTWGWDGYYLSSELFDDYYESGSTYYYALVDGDPYIGTVEITFNEPLTVSRLGIVNYNYYSSTGQVVSVKYKYEGESEYKDFSESYSIGNLGLTWCDLLDEIGTEKKVQSISVTIDAYYAYGDTFAELYILALDEE